MAAIQEHGVMLPVRRTMRDMHGSSQGACRYVPSIISGYGVVLSSVASGMVV
jgi:hypothetical protein